MADESADPVLPDGIEESFRIGERSAKVVAAANQRTLDSMHDGMDLSFGILDGHTLAALAREAARKDPP